MINNEKRIPVVFLFYVLTVFLFSGCSTSSTITAMKESNISFNKGEGQLITISTFNSEGIGSIWAYDCNNEKITPLLNDRKVMVSGKLNTDRDTLAFSDAPGDNAWDKFTLSLKDNKIQQVTSDEIGQFKVCFEDKTNKIIYSQAGGKDYPVPRIAKVDIKNNKTEYLNISKNDDCGVGCFDIINGKMIIHTYSYSNDVKGISTKALAS